MSCSATNTRSAIVMTTTLAPDTMPLREILRGMRHGMRRTRRILRTSIPPEFFPGPAAFVARPVLDGLDAIAHEVDTVGTSLARRLLSGQSHVAPPFGTQMFEALTGAPDRDGDFAATIYVALRSALRRIGDGDAFVSEAAARRSHAVAVQLQPSRPRETIAADLVLALVAKGAVRDVAVLPGLRVPAADVAAVAVTAVLLWLLADHSDAEPDAALDAATDIAVAIADEVVTAVVARDRARLARLLGEFASHV